MLLRNQEITDERYILGISAYAHDASAALLKDGEIVMFVEEERLSRVKHTTAFPELAIKTCLDKANFSMSEVDRICYFWRPLLEVSGNLQHVFRYFPASLRLLSAPGGSGDTSFVHRQKKMLNLDAEVKEHFGTLPKNKTFFCEHHLAHAASAYFLSPFESAAILTIDGRGEADTTLFCEGHGQKISKLQSVKVPHSLGHFYAAITSFLGFKPFHDEWKVMGLSSYGSKKFVESFQELYSLTENSFRLNLNYFSFHTHGTTQWLGDRFIKKFAPPNAATPEQLFAFKADIAKAAQLVVEEVGLHLAKSIRRTTGQKNLCLAGGVALNCLMNRRILEESGFEEIFFQPVANDAGTSLGAALYYANHIIASKRPLPMRNVFWGPRFSNEEILAEIHAAGLTKDITLSKWTDPNEIALLLASGNVVGWFQGAMEGGPRALGHRSILADPGRPEMKDKINSIIKKRESFRPFAPVTLKEKASTYFQMPNNVESPYMILIGDVRPEWESKISSVVHVDGTCRVQTVDHDEDPLFYDLISAFGAKSGYSVLLNTSFNENEPIVCKPSEAINCFLRTQMDSLVIGSWLLEKGK